MKAKEYDKEKQKLEETIETINEVLEIETGELEALFKDFVGDINDLRRIAKAKKIHISNLEKSKEKPYFARIDFKADESGKFSSIYIGKNGIIHNSSIVVTDWRAPICSLYYDAEIGDCSYISPDGRIEGQMLLKRQYEIDKGELCRYFDVNLVTNDELLQKYLNSNNDTRLKSIVSTIQQEQNDVIRRKITDNLIIQGVAGSGKTTVALHRIAYLVYNYIKNINQNQYLVIGPNPVFLKYIETVLPELDVSGVEQYTFEQFSLKYINEDININDSNKKAMVNISKKNNTDIDKFKSSMKYKEMIDKFLEVYFNSITSKPLMFGDFEVLPKEVIRKTFAETTQLYSANLNNIIEITINKLCRIIEDNYDQIISNYNNYEYESFKNATTPSEKDKLRKKSVKEKQEIGKYCKNTLTSYFNKAKKTPTELYKLFINTIENFNIYNYDQISTLKKETKKNIKNKSYDFEDLASLIYIKSIINPDKYYTKIKHTVIDEAQDLGEFNFYVLRKVLSSSTFSIFGDLAQSIFDYRGINNWQEVDNVMFDNKGIIINFNKSYRTTNEIMSVADSVANSLGLNSSELVVRQGNPVSLTNIENVSNVAYYIADKIIEYKEKGYKTIAVISKTDLLSKYINDDLRSIGLDIPNISIEDDLNDDRFNICTISNQLAKGLEFDAVIINDTSERIYSSNSELDMKLLYVAITRALHELDITYSGELTFPLKEYFKDKLSKNVKERVYKK